METFVRPLDEVVAYLCDYARKTGKLVTLDKAPAVLEDGGFDVPGTDLNAQKAAIRGMLAWVDSSVGAFRPGPNGGFGPADMAAKKDKAASQGIVGTLRAQGVIQGSGAKVAPEEQAEILRLVQLGREAERTLQATG
jgi:hypothetical protein